MLNVLHWMVCGGIGGLAALFLIANISIVIAISRTGKSASLVFPFISGPVCAMCCWLSPSDTLQNWFWLPLVLDFPWWFVPGLIVRAVFRKFANKAGNADP